MSDKENKTERWNPLALEGWGLFALKGVDVSTLKDDEKKNLAEAALLELESYRVSAGMSSYITRELLTDQMRRIDSAYVKLSEQFPLITIRGIAGDKRLQTLIEKTEKAMKQALEAAPDADQWILGRVSRIKSDCRNVDVLAAQKPLSSRDLIDFVESKGTRLSDPTKKMLYAAEALRCLVCCERSTSDDERATHYQGLLAAMDVIFKLPKGDLKYFLDERVFNTLSVKGEQTTVMPLSALVERVKSEEKATTVVTPSSLSTSVEQQTPAAPSTKPVEQVKTEQKATATSSSSTPPTKPVEKSKEKSGLLSSFFGSSKQQQPKSMLSIGKESLNNQNSSGRVDKPGAYEEEPPASTKPTRGSDNNG